MPSIVPGFEYDIFISYRQKDNKGERWVTAFVNALKSELESTFKEDISIYFDENPHDGLHDHHDVDDSLREKLKCLILIPVISRTYCDPNSFAWQQEFCAFVDLVKQDNLGLKMKLPNGNVASRVLPVQIHELDKTDSGLFETITGSVMRPIDFVYKSSGVNRPLRPHEDSPGENQHHTVFRDQINKTANAIKEIIDAIKQPTANSSPQGPSRVREVINEKPKKSFNKILLAGSVLIIVLFVIGYYLLKKDVVEKGTSSISIAIIPFRNYATDDKLKNFGFGIASEIRTQLSLSNQFRFVTSDQATVKYTESQLSPPEIAKELGVEYLVLGSVQQLDNKLKISVELVDGKKGTNIWSVPSYESALASMDDLFGIQSEIAAKVLKAFSFQKNYERAIPTKNVAAYSFYLSARESDNRADWVTAVVQSEKAIQLDSGFLDAYVSLVYNKAFIYWADGIDTVRREKELKPIMDLIEKKFPESWESMVAKGVYNYQGLKDFEKGLEWFEKALVINPNSDIALALSSAINNRRLKLERALHYRLRQLDINPTNAVIWQNIAIILYNNGNVDDGIKAAHVSLLWNRVDSDLFSYAFILGGHSNKGTLEQLPDELKMKFSRSYRSQLFRQRRLWRDLIRLADTATVDLYYSRIDKLIDKVYGFHFTGQNDSLQINLGKAIKELKNLNDNPWQLFHGAAMVGLLSNKNEALKNFQGLIERLPTKRNQDLEWVKNKLISTITFLSLRGDYEKATNMLIELNRRFPEFGNYNMFFIEPLFDKIKEEYPPFVTALNNLKLPPKLDISEQLNQFQK